MKDGAAADHRSDLGSRFAQLFRHRHPPPPPSPPGMRVRSRARNVTAVDVSAGRIGANLNVSAVYRNVKFQRFIHASELMNVSCVPRDCLRSH